MPSYVINFDPKCMKPKLSENIAVLVAKPFKSFFVILSKYYVM